MPKISTPAVPHTTETVKNGEPKSKPTAVKRPIHYPEVKCLIFKGEKALTAEQAKEYLGWKVVTSGDFDLTDEFDNEIRLVNNIGDKSCNRGFKPLRCRMYMQLILEKQWEFNLEAMIIGASGLVISAQHRLAALILANQEWETNPDKWPKWKTAPTLECIINVGCDESDRVINTIDTGEPRSFSDVIYRSHYFSNMPRAIREKLATMTMRAVQTVEHRTDARKDAFSPGRPHAEGIEFLDAHLTILKCVKHISEEDCSKKGIGYYVSPGYAAGLMYLMACGKTEAARYFSTRDEKSADLTNLELASAFFAELAGGSSKLSVVREQASAIINEFQRISPKEAFALLIKAWLRWSVEKPVTANDLQLDYYTDPEDSLKHLRDFPTVGGIDVGEIDLLAAIEGDRDEDGGEVDDPTQEEIDERAALERAGRERKMKSGKNGYKPKVGDTVYVEEDGGVFSGEVTELYSTHKAGLVAKLRMKNGNETEVPAKDCLSYNPQVEG